MQPRPRFPQNPRSLYRRLNEEAQRLRKEAMGTQPGVRRDRLIRRARRAEIASRTTEWLSSPGLETPK
nr:hypothetical protein [Bradyrhizobium sp.]